MRARAYRDPARDMIVVHLESAPGYWVTQDRSLVQVEPGVAPPVFLELDARDARDVLAAISQELPWGDEAREALADTRHVRDRLLTLVEKVMAQ